MAKPCGVRPYVVIALLGRLNKRSTKKGYIGSSADEGGRQNDLHTVVSPWDTSCAWRFWRTRTGPNRHRRYKCATGSVGGCERRHHRERQGAGARRLRGRPRGPGHDPGRDTGTVADMDQLLTIDEAAARLGTGERFVRRLIAERRICFHKIGRHVRISSTDLQAFVAAARVEPVPTWSGPRSVGSLGHRRGA